MRILVQRVSAASVVADGVLSGEIANGLLLFVGFQEGDGEREIEYGVRKVLNLRVFDDGDGVMNLSLKEIEGALLVVSQFTLYGATRRGNRPSYIKAAPPHIAEPLYNTLLKRLKEEYKGEVESGKFGADMKVKLINDGPVTIWIDSEE